MLRRHVLAAVAAFSLLVGGQAAQAGRDVLVVDLVNEPSSLDPHIQWNPDSYYVYRNIFDNLVTRDDAGKIVPQIATGWRQVSDTVIEFDIRQGVTFHDGTPLTAEDVAFSVRRIIDPELKSPQLSQFNRIDKAEVVDGSRLRITTKGPYPVLMAQLVKLSIVPKAYVEKLGRDEFNLKPIGSGPYRFAGWQRGVRVTLEANPATGATSRAFRRPSSMPCPTSRRAWPICAAAARISRSRWVPTRRRS
jgi:peptide/nickel transport system substrate-binding protein